MSYLIAGSWHFAAALAFAAALGILSGDAPGDFTKNSFAQNGAPGGDALFWLRRPGFSIPLLISSSALFFIPQSLAKKGLLKFLHYPLPDWDVLLLGPASHRHWLTHSPVLPLFAWWLSVRYPLLRHPYLPFDAVAVGLCIGVGSHLFWDCVGSRRHKIVFVPHWMALREAASRIYLLTGAVVALAVAAYFCDLVPDETVFSYRRLASETTFLSR